VVLVGLSGAGKSTVARLAAALLDAPWCDLDQQVEARTGRPVREIIAIDGEPAFRRLEREAMATALAGPPRIIAAGAGWAAEPGNLDLAGTAALTLYLCVSPEAAADRLGIAADRPLLAGDVLPRLREQLATREPWYRRAAVEIDADAAPDLVAAAVAAAARRHGGW
jgi:shikimate kinase